MNRISTGISLFTFSFLLAACGGGGSGDLAMNPPPTDSIDRSGRTTGPVTGFGSVFVNGVEFETDSSTTIIVDGDNSASEADLRVGEIVTIDGTVNSDGITGQAVSIVHTNNVEGPIESIDLANSSMVVLGQDVLTDVDTIFDSSIQPGDLSGLALADTVEVSGFINSNGAIVATYIERKALQNTLEALGKVSSLDDTNSLFSLGALVVDFSNASLEGFAASPLANDDFVKAEGDALGSNGELIATRVEKADNGSLDATDEGTEIELEGLITRFVDAQDFDVNATRVTTNSATEFEGGSASDLGPDQRVEVEGSVDSTGDLVADKVSIKHQSDSKLEAAVDPGSLDIPNGRFSALGVSVTVDELTQYEDESSIESNTFSLQEINENDFIKLLGIANANAPGEISANRIERTNPQSNVELKGLVESVNRPVLTVLGVPVSSDGSTLFEDRDENSLSADEFFTQVQNGSLIEVEGQENPDNEVLASKIQLK